MLKLSIMSKLPLRILMSRAGNSWGYHTMLDCYNCNPTAIRSKKEIKNYVDKLCALIDMKKFGKCHIVHFGAEERVAGYSMFQFIETSCISGHFANLTNDAYIDVFSCKPYNVSDVLAFTKEYFKTEYILSKFINRY